MAQLVLLIFKILWIISISAIEGDRNVNHRSLRSGNLQEALQPVNHFGNYPSKDEPISYPGDKRKKKRRKRKPIKSGIKSFSEVDSSEYYDYYYDDNDNDETSEQKGLFN
jgi:hypothetical protein